MRGPLGPGTAPILTLGTRRMDGGGEMTGDSRHFDGDRSLPNCGAGAYHLHGIQSWLRLVQSCAVLRTPFQAAVNRRFPARGTVLVWYACGDGMHV